MREHTELYTSLAQVFSCEFCEIYNNTFSYRTPTVAASLRSTNEYFTFSSLFFYGTKYILWDQIYFKNQYMEDRSFSGV